MKKLSHLGKFLKKHAKLLSIIFGVLFFIVLFVIAALGSLRVFLPHSMQITGFPFGQKNYLIIFQNNNELRPSGGFISSFAHLQFTSGIPSNLQIEDVYGDIDEHPYQEPPYPMEQLLANEWYQGYTFRDGNYQADFPQTAQELQNLFNLTQPNQNFDGIIAVNLNVLHDVVEALGPFYLDGREINHHNLFEEITNSVNDIDRHNKEQLANRKGILKPLASAIIRKVILNPLLIRPLSDIITENLDQKEIQLYFDQPSLQNLAKKNDWTGAWPELAGDFLAVVEANLGGMKSDRYLQRNITYHLLITEENLQAKTDPKATLSLDLYHYGIENIPLSGPYSGYFRFYNSPQDQVADQIVKLNPGERTTIEKSWTIPYSHIEDSTYSLQLIKQSGTEDFYTIIIELPRGYTLQSEDFHTKENIAFFQGILSHDLQLKLVILPDTYPPRLVKQSNDHLNQISLHFNEDLNLSHAEDPFTYEVIDLNVNSPETTDQIIIKNVEITSKDIFLNLEGQTNQHEEHYGVLLKNLRDTKGNILSTRQITVVQRLKD